jgi:hypothetical protein
LHVVGALEAASLGDEVAMEIVPLSQSAPIGIRQANNVLVKALIAECVA